MTAPPADVVPAVDEEEVEEVMERGRGADEADRKPLPLRSPISAVGVALNYGCLMLTFQSASELFVLFCLLLLLLLFLLFPLFLLLLLLLSKNGGPQLHILLIKRNR